MARRTYSLRPTATVFSARTAATKRGTTSREEDILTSFERPQRLEADVCRCSIRLTHGGELDGTLAMHVSIAQATTEQMGRRRRRPFVYRGSHVGLHRVRRIPFLLLSSTFGGVYASGCLGSCIRAKTMACGRPCSLFPGGKKIGRSGLERRGLLPTSAAFAAMPTAQ